MISILNLSNSPVGVRFLENSEEKNAEIVKKHRYCQTLMKARNVANVINW